MNPIAHDSVPFLSGCSVTWLARLHGVQKVAGSNPVTPTYRPEDRALSPPEVNNPGSERAYRFLALFHLVEPELDPVDEEPEDFPAAGWFVGIVDDDPGFPRVIDDKGFPSRRKITSLRSRSRMCPAETL
jgi:hypothetical protein